LCTGIFFGCSSFEEIFDVDHFINSLKDDVSIIRVLPKEFSWSTREYYGIGIRATRIKTAPLHASANWYLENVSPILQRFEKNWICIVAICYACVYMLWKLLVLT